MRIVIDLQGAQTQSRYRGIGRYSLSLALAIARNAGEHEIWLVLNEAFVQSAVSIANQFKDFIPPERIRVFQAPRDIAEHDPKSFWRARTAEIIRESFLEQLNPDVVFVTSLFEGFVDDAVTSIGMFSQTTKVAVILYDLIPYLHPEKYLSSQTQQNYYARKIQSLKKADLLLSISDSTMQECIKALNFSQNKITSISAAVESAFHPLQLQVEQIQSLYKKYNITQKIVMYAPGGFDERKNFDNLIYAYGMLSQDIRAQHQLLIVSKVSDEDRQNLLNIEKKAGLKKGEMIITGYVSEDDLKAFYNLATLFVFPSKHEGFGLPALEAMACGTPTIGANTTSVPEVIGWDEALFDPFSVESISQKIEQALTNETFRQKLKKHAISQAALFSWDESAKKAISFLEKNQINSNPALAPVTKRKLAYFSPLPPLKSGISDYSKELIEYLGLYYDITLIVDLQANTKNIPNMQTQTSLWFLENFQNFDRILYHFGNSPYHSYMVPILKQHAGVIVMHDFFMSGMLAYEELNIGKNQAWTKALHHSHGYVALEQRFAKDGIENAKMQYPCNLEILQNSIATIAHSNYSNQLAKEWYGTLLDAMHIIPLLRVPSKEADMDAAREKLSIPKEAFVVCSFGLIDPAKLSHILLEAFIHSDLANDTNAHLIFVGENHGGEYGLDLVQAIKKSGLKNRIFITGWVDSQTYQEYLIAADVGVQLRTSSRGETSAAVLDCMNYALATITNANGSMADLPRDAVWMLEDTFITDELTTALESLQKNKDQRETLGAKAKEVIATRHNPQACAKNYFDVIESAYAKQKHTLQQTINAIADIQGFTVQDEDLLQTAQALSVSTYNKTIKKQLLVDVSSIVKNDLRTGIERVVRAQLLEFLKNPPMGYAVEPVYLQNDKGYSHYRYAREYACKILNIHGCHLGDEILEVANGDIFYCADFFRDGITEAAQSGLFTQWQAMGVSLNFTVYDLLPLLMPQFFPKDSDTNHALWLTAIASCADNLVCISQTVAEELSTWIQTAPNKTNQNLKISFAHLGADIDASSPTAAQTKQSKPTFLMVATIEPRKGHLQVLEAFEKLWDMGHDVQLILVGTEGWKPLPQSQRRTIPAIIQKVRAHSQLNKRLFWLEGISDVYLEEVYATSTCLIAASEGEGFGLPLIEAAQHKLPIIARDIPVFKEVAQEHAHYFQNSNNPQVVVDAIQIWLELYKTNTHPKSDNMPWLTWRENAQKLIQILTKSQR